MRNVVILGAGRSGTSMVAGLFQRTGAFYGFDLIDATPANPYGYYEDRILNTLNDLIVGRVVRSRLMARLPPVFAPRCHRDSRAFWLAAPRRLRPLRLQRELRRLQRVYAARTPFCLKDPRFSVTLPYWRPILPAETGCIAVFRDPDRCVDSQLRDTEESYRPPLRVSAAWAYRSWHRNYLRIVDELARQGDWFFVHYDQVVDAQAVGALERFVEAPLVTEHVDPGISRASPVRRMKGGPAAASRQLYERLQTRAEESIERWSTR